MDRLVEGGGGRLAKKYDAKSEVGNPALQESINYIQQIAKISNSVRISSLENALAVL